MNIAIPLDESDTICSINDVKVWAFALLENGETKEIKRFESRDKFDGFVDFVVVKDRNDEFDDFLDEGSDVLVAPFQKSVEDILEAFVFRELYQL